MENLTEDQVQLILTLFRLQNAERDIEDFVPSFHNSKYGFSQYKKIGDLELYNTSLVASDDNGVFSCKWGILDWFDGQFNVARVGEDFRFEKDEPFDIMEHISFDDKI